MLFYKMRILSVGPPSCSNLYLESSYPRRDLMPSPCRIKPLQLVPGQEHGAEAMAGSGPGAAAVSHARDYSGRVLGPSADLPGSACQPPTHPQRHSGGDSQCSRLRFLSGTSAGRSRQLPSRRCFVGAQGIAQPSHGARGVVWTLVNNLSMLPEPGDLFPTRCSTVLRAALGSNQLGLNRKLALQHPAPEPLGFRVVHMFLLELVECPALGMIRGPGGPPPPGSTLRCCGGPGPRGSCVGAPATSVALGR